MWAKARLPLTPDVGKIAYVRIKKLDEQRQKAGSQRLLEVDRTGGGNSLIKDGARLTGEKVRKNIGARAASKRGAKKK